MTIFGSLMMLVAAAIQPPPDEERARFDQAVARQRAFEQSQFVEAGFRPIGELAAEGRQVRRVLFTEGRFILAIPGIEIERHASGAVTLTIVGRGVLRPPITLPAETWDRLAARDGAVFQTRVFVRRDPNAPIPPPPPICHPWLVRFASTGPEGIRSDSLAIGCDEIPRERLEAAIEFARLAVSTRSDCTFEENNAFWSYRRCFPSPPAAPEPS